MPSLLALALPPGPAFVDALRAAWDRGHAVLPLDPRLPVPAVEALLDALRPGEVVGADGDRRPRPGGRPVEDGDAVVVATSGSTGAPKGVVLTHDAVAASARATSTRLDVDPGTDRWIACLPLAHVGGLGVVTRALLTGTALSVLSRFDPDRLRAEAGRGPALVSLVPTALDRTDPALFKAVVLGGSADWRARPGNVVRTYGMTETGGGVVYDGVPLDGVEVREVGGELHVRGPTLLRAYRDGTDPKASDGWLPTGDAGAVGDDGRVVVHGRLGDVIVSGGEKVWPDPVERRLATHPAVAEVAVAGQPDPEWGQRVLAFVVPADPAAPPALAELRAWVRQVLPPWAAPRQLVLVEGLPRTPLGKVRRAVLSSEAARPGARPT